MTSIMVIFLIIGVFSTHYIHDAYACSCASPVDYVGVTMESEYAFIGTVTHIDNSDGPQKVHFDVSSVIKGDITDNTFVLENTNIINGPSSMSSTCDVGYQKGVTYNVFVFDNSFMNNGMCSTKATGLLGIMDPLQYNLFHIVILVLMIIVIVTVSALVVKRKRR